MSDARLRRDVVWNLVPVALLAAAGLGSNFAIYTWWDGEALAVFNLVTIAFLVLADLGACGLQFSVLRAVAEAPDDREHVASVVVGALIPNVVISAVVALAFVALRGPFSALHSSDMVGEGMLVAAPGLFCFSINKILFNVTNGLRRMRAFAVYTSLRYAMILVGIVIAHAAHVGAARLAIVWSITECTVFVALVGELFATVALRRAAHWKTWARRHLDFGLRGVVATLAADINSKLDVWMLGASGISKTLVGIYALAGALNEGASQLGIVVQNNLNPIIARSFAEGKPADIVDLARRTRTWFVPGFVVATAIGAVAYPTIIPRLMADTGPGAVPFAILMLGLALASPYLPFGSILLMANRPGWHTFLVVTVVAINLVANVALIPVLGLAGAAAATALSVVSMAILVRVLTRRVVGVAF